jgi:Zn-dependent peptidase ImmA (M78 family)
VLSIGDRASFEIPMPQRYSYQHPGYAFLNQYGSLQAEEDVSHYVEFLRQEAGMSDQIPSDLAKIYQRFCIPEPLRVPLEEQQGILFDTYKGVILIKEDDPIVRQRFTEGHELMELLFDAQTDVQTRLNLPNWDANRKEQLCDRGAAELLMPRSTFLPRLNRWGVSLTTAKKLASLYKTSLMATLMRMLELTTEQCALVVWHRDLKPTEKRRNFDTQPEKKIRIRWRRTSPNWKAGFIPKDKSVDDQSLIGQTFALATAQSGEETFTWGGQTIACQVETRPIQRQPELLVISLLTLP